MKDFDDIKMHGTTIKNYLLSVCLILYISQRECHKILEPNITHRLFPTYVVKEN
jgi:hypothetical protein